MLGTANYIVTGEYMANVYQNLVKEAELESQEKAIEKYLKKHKKEIMENKINTGMIMDGISQSSEQLQAKENLDTAIGVNQEQVMAAMAAYKARHTTYKREYKIGRNDPCPCGAVDENGKPMKYKNCCLKTGKYEQKIKA